MYGRVLQINYVKETAFLISIKGGLMNPIRYQSKVSGETRPYNAINHTSPMQTDTISTINYQLSTINYQLSTNNLAWRRIKDKTVSSLEIISAVTAIPG